MAQVLPFNGFYTGTSKKNSSRTCVNYMPVPYDAGSLSEYTLQSTMGIAEAEITEAVFPRDPISLSSKIFNWGADGGALARNICGIYQGGFLAFYDAFFGIRIEDLRPNHELTDAQISFNKDYLLVVDSTGASRTLQAAYLYNSITSTAIVVNIFTTLGADTRITDTAYLGDRFLLMSNDEDGGNRNKVFYSNINDPESYDGSFFSSITQSNANRGIHVLNGRIYLFSIDGYTVWTNSPSVNLPFIAQKGSEGSLGLLSASGKVEINGRLFLVGRESGSLGFYIFSAGGYQRISTEFIDQDLNKVNRAYAFSFSDDGRDFVGFDVFKFSGESKTYCYDIKTGEFHIRKSSGDIWNVMGSALTNYGTHIVAGSGSSLVGGSTYKLQVGFEDKTIGTEFGVQVARECVTSPFNSDGVTNNVRELTFQTDIDYTTFDPSLDHPKLGLEVSGDFGNTYGQQMFQEFENIGETDRLLRFMSIGFFRQAFVFKITTNIPYPHSLLKMLVRLQKGFRQI
jgi:hypothetical protein